MKELRCHLALSPHESEIIGEDKVPSLDAAAARPPAAACYDPPLVDLCLEIDEDKILTKCARERVERQGRVKGVGVCILVGPVCC